MDLRGVFWCQLLKCMLRALRYCLCIQRSDMLMHF